jgi:hypothetical protein
MLPNRSPPFELLLIKRPSPKKTLCTKRQSPKKTLCSKRPSPKKTLRTNKKDAANQASDQQTKLKAQRKFADTKIIVDMDHSMLMTHYLKDTTTAKRNASTTTNNNKRWATWNDERLRPEKWPNMLESTIMRPKKQATQPLRPSAMRPRLWKKRSLNILKPVKNCS